MIHNPRAAPLGNVRQNSFLAAIMLSVLATAGFFCINIMSVLVDALGEGLHFSEKDAGLVASLNVYGAAIGALAAVFVVARVPWRPLSAGLLLILISMDIASIYATTPVHLMSLRFIHGLVAGLLVGTSYSVVARMDSPDRTFGVLLFLQFGAAGVAVWFLPSIVRDVGAWIVFLVLVGFSTFTLAILPFVPNHIRRERLVSEIHEAVQGSARLPIAMTLMAIMLFQGANMAVAAFAIPMGTHYGLQIAPISQALGIAGWLSMLGSIPVILFSTRFGRLVPVIVGMVLLLISSWAFHFSASLTVYFIANTISGAAWCFIIPYFLGMCAAFDPTGRAAVLGGFFSKLGLASGPLCAGLMLKHQNYDLLIDVSVGVLALSAIPGLFAAALLDRRTQKISSLAVVAE